MELALAKEFIFCPIIFDEGHLYISKDLNKLMEMNKLSLTGIYAVIDTSNGEKLFEMDFSYSGEPIIMRVFIHKDSFLSFNNDREIINL